MTVTTIAGAGGGAQTLIGGAGANDFIPGAVPSVIEGAGTNDIVSFTGTASEFLLDVTGTAIAITPDTPGAAGTATIQNVGGLNFSGEPVAVAGWGGGGLAINSGPSGPQNIFLAGGEDTVQLDLTYLDTIVATAATVTVNGGDDGGLIGLGSGGGVVFTHEFANTVVAGAGAATVAAIDPYAGALVPVALVFGGGGALTFFGTPSLASGPTVPSMLCTLVGGAGSETVLAGEGGVFGGGTGGRNFLDAQTGASTMIGGGADDTLVAGGTGQILAAGSGNETLTGFNATGGNVFFAGSGPDAIFGGPGADTFVAGTGAATMWSAGGADLFVFNAARGGGAVTIGGFDPTQAMKLTLQGYGPGAISAALANASTNNGSEKFALSDGTRITLLGVASVGDSSFA